MSLFSRTLAQVDALEAQISAFDASASLPLPARKEAADAVNSTLVELQPTVGKIVAKAEAGERDPNRRTYGASMVAKIFAMRDRFEKLTSDFTPRYETLCEEWTAFEKKQREEDERKRELEEQARQAEEARREAEREKERLEKEEREREEKEREEELRRQKQEEEKRAAELREAERKKVEAEKQEAERKRREEEEAAALKKKQEEEAAAAARDIEMAQASKTISLSIRTTRGVTHTLDDIAPDSTVADVKVAIERAHGIVKAAQRLIFQGRLLVDGNKISTYKIVDGSAIHLVENPRAAAAAAASSSTAVEKLLVPAGTVCHLQNGKSEYDSILAQCGSHRLVVTDWFAPWCGPCRAISPAFERLANRFSDVTFVKVDTEASAANGQLAAENNISAYPTFHFVLNSGVKHSFSGANASAIEANIKKYRAMAIPKASVSATRSVGSQSGGPQGTITSRVMTALTALKRTLGMSEFTVAVRTLLTFVRNIVNNPGMEKYRRVRTANSTFQTRLGSKQGGMDCMRAFGFEEVVENGDRFLVMSAAAAEAPELRTVMTQLESALAQASGSTGDASAAGSAGTAGGAAPMGDDMRRALGGLAGMMGAGGGGAGAGGMDSPESMFDMLGDPSFRQVASEMANDPQAMVTMLQAQQAIANGDMETLNRLRSNPTMTRLQNVLMGNPVFLRRMMRHVAEHGIPDMGGMGAAGGGIPGTNADAGGNGGDGGGVGGGNGAQGGNEGGTPAPPQYPGAPTTAEEEERLLQEAIRLSMQDQGGQQGRQDGSKEGGEDSADKQS